MNNNWLEKAKKRLEQEASRPAAVAFERLKAQGMIDDQGRVTGHIRHWDAFLAVVEVNYDPAREKILLFRCLKPVFGMPGGATIDIRRESIIEYLKNGKRIITAIRDENLGMWKEGDEVRLTPNGFLLTTANNEAADNLGSLSEFTPERMW